MAQPGRFQFPSTLRVKRGQDFDRAYQLRKRRDEGCAVLYGAPNGLALPRLGLSVSRRVGSAATRNAHKRCWREAFRLAQHELPPGMDVVVVVRPHALRAVEDYRSILLRCARALAGTGS